MDLIYKIHTVFMQHDGIGQVGLQHMRGIRDRHTAVDLFLHHLKLGRIENMQGRGIEFPLGVKHDGFDVMQRHGCPGQFLIRTHRREFHAIRINLQLIDTEQISYGPKQVYADNAEQHGEKETEKYRNVPAPQTALCY
jgi:hypothetical protein